MRNPGSILKTSLRPVLIHLLAISLLLLGGSGTRFASPAGKLIRFGDGLNQRLDWLAGRPEAAHWPQVKTGQMIHLGRGGHFSWRAEDGRYLELRGPGSAVLEENGARLLSGSLWVGQTPPPKIVFDYPAKLPAQGRIARLAVRSPVPFKEIRLFSLPARVRFDLHLDKKEASTYHYSCFLALAKTDSRRELRLELEAQAELGRFNQIIALPVSAKQDTPIDQTGVFTRSGYQKPSFANHSPGAVFGRPARVLKLEEQVAWKNPTKPRPGFPPWSLPEKKPPIWLPPEKLALLRDQAGIRRENAIHSEATSFDTPEILWEGPFIVPAWHRYSSPFSETRNFVGLGTGVHLGIDIAAFHGIAVAAPNSGIVRFAGKTTMCGNNVIIDHGRRVFTKILHLDSLLVKTGQRIKRGQAIGMTGTTGMSTGPHIHWEMLVHGVRVDPEEWVALRPGGLR